MRRPWRWSKWSCPEVVNKEIVKNINDMGGKAIGLSGKDGSLLVAKQVEGKDIGSSAR